MLSQTIQEFEAKVTFFHLNRNSQIPLHFPQLQALLRQPTALRRDADETDQKGDSSFNRGIHDDIAAVEAFYRVHSSL